MGAFEKDAQLSKPGAKMTLSGDLLLAQALLFFLGGFHTMESLLIYAAYELALHPEIQDKLAEELRDAMDNNGELNYGAVNELEYLDMAILETLRKYPTAVRAERKCTKGYRVPNSNLLINEGTFVVTPIRSIHQDEDHYSEPNQFNPERFNKDKRKRHPNAYMPFGAGPRNCIAMRFSITEGKAAIAHLINNFILRPTTRTTIPKKLAKVGNLKPVNGMWLNVSPRK